MDKQTAKMSLKKTATKLDPKPLIAAIGNGRTPTKYKRGQPIFRQGDPADAVFYIEKGKVKITVISDQGKEGVIAILDTFDFFGEGCLAGQPLHIATASAISECAIVRIEKQAMIRKLHDDPVFSEKFLAFMLSRNIQIEEDLIDQLFNSSEKRLARVLLLLANFGKDGKLEPIIPPVNQDLLAAKVGTTRSRINFFMNKFRKLGFIDYNGHLKVHSSLINVIIHDE